ncbi:hypothetical protein PUN28_003765 [Cardiocondyla obscurior]|uniref:Uncharacterized protein n=1 Tax=Cardiocondyla obscurior TaxID=286306 RepID=A0AAW2GP88_9HYME
MYKLGRPGRVDRAECRGRGYSAQSTSSAVQAVPIGQSVAVADTRRKVQARPSRLYQSDRVSRSRILGAKYSSAVQAMSIGQSVAVADARRNALAREAECRGRKRSKKGGGARERPSPEGDGIGDGRERPVKGRLGSARVVDRTVTRTAGSARSRGGSGAPESWTKRSRGRPEAPGRGKARERPNRGQTVTRTAGSARTVTRTAGSARSRGGSEAPESWTERSRGRPGAPGRGKARERPSRGQTVTRTAGSARVVEVTVLRKAGSARSRESSGAPESCGAKSVSRAG